LQVTAHLKLAALGPNLQGCINEAMKIRQSIFAPLLLDK